MDSPDEATTATALFAGQGELRARCRALEWAATPLGPVESWPQSLRTAADLVLASTFPSIVLWGPELVQLYNDAYVPILGVKHPWGLGMSTSECWPEVWAFNAPIYERVFAGETVTLHDQHYPLRRHGPDTPPDDVYLTISYVPVRDETGGVGGVFITLFDTTAQVQTRALQAERDRLHGVVEAERARLEYVFRHAPAFLGVVRGPEHVFELANDAYYELIGHRDILGKPVWDAMPEVRGQGFIELLDDVLATGTPFVGRELPILLARTAGAPPEERFVDFVYQPLVEADGTRSGVVAHGSDVTGQVRSRREVERLLAGSDAARRSLEDANAQLQEQQLELELANQQLQDNAAELEMQAEELQATAIQLEERTEEAERGREAVAASERQLRALADAIPTLAWTARVDGYIDWYNARWYEYTGTTPADMAGWGWQSVHDPAALPNVLARWQESIATGRAFEMTFPLRGADGRSRRFLTRVVPLRDAEGRVVRWFGTNTDVEGERTAREAAEQAARRTGRLQALTASLARAHTLDDVADVVVAQVAAEVGAVSGMLALRMPGADDATIVRQTGLTGDVLARYARFSLDRPGPAAECLRLGEPIFVESRDGPAGLFARFPEIPDIWASLGTHALATVPLTVSGRAVGAMSFTFGAPRALTPEDRAFFLAVGQQGAQAVERARLLEAEQVARAGAETARAAAEGANRTKTDFLATMSHELRTPLNAIAGYAELLEIGIHGPITESQREALSRIQRSQRHLLGLINDVLNFAKLEAGHVEYRLTDVVVRDAVDALEPLVAPQLRAKTLRFEMEACTDGRGEPVRVRADADKLQQILVNLLSNAIKFTPAGGAVMLRCAVLGDVVTLAVQDTGIGIAADRLEQVFAPFVQIDRRLNAPHEGTGLGLSISRDLARGMGGDLTAESTPGVGSTFTLALPAGADTRG